MCARYQKFALYLNNHLVSPIRRLEVRVSPKWGHLSGSTSDFPAASRQTNIRETQISVSGVAELRGRRRWRTYPPFPLAPSTYFYLWQIELCPPKNHSHAVGPKQRPYEYGLNLGIWE